MPHLVEEKVFFFFIYALVLECLEGLVSLPVAGQRKARQGWWAQSKRPASQPETSQLSTEEAGKQDGRYRDEVNESQESA